MTKVQFKRGLKAQMPTIATTDTLLFSMDTNEVFMGRGTSIAKMGDVYYGYADLTDLQTKEQTPISGKLYLTEDSKLYSFQNGVFSLVAGSSTIASFEADKVTYDNTTSALTSTNVQSAIDEVNTKAEVNKTDITTVKGRVDVLETDNTQNKADIADIKSKEGLVKLDANDTSAYLGEKLDGVTVQVVDGKVKVVGLDGVTVGSTELNHLTGITGNVQTQLNDLLASISASTSGMTFGNTIDTKAELDALTNVVNGTVYIVLADETKENGRTMYIYSEDTASFVFLGLFEFAQKFIQLLDTPDAYVDGKVLKSTDSGIAFGDIGWEEIQNKPTSTIVQLDDAVAKTHEHTFDEILLNKLSDVDGELQYDGKSVSKELQWEDFSI